MKNKLSQMNEKSKSKQETYCVTPLRARRGDDITKQPAASNDNKPLCKRQRERVRGNTLPDCFDSVKGRRSRKFKVRLTALFVVFVAFVSIPNLAIAAANPSGPSS